MDNAQKAIMIGVGLFITIIVIAAVMLITGIGQDLLNSGTNQLSGITDSMDQSVIDQIDDNSGKTLGKSQAVALCDQIHSLNGTVKLKVPGSSGGSFSTYTLSGTSTGDTVTTFKNRFISGKKYTVSGDFSSGITFTQE